VAQAMPIPASPSPSVNSSLYNAAGRLRSPLSKSYSAALLRSPAQALHRWGEHLDETDLHCFDGLVDDGVPRLLRQLRHALATVCGVLFL
jgi:hypothetical protein